jgi:hypothetical protein
VLTAGTEITCKTSPVKTSFAFCSPTRFQYDVLQSSPGKTQFTAFEPFRKIALSYDGKQGAVGCFLFLPSTACNRNRA